MFDELFPDHNTFLAKLLEFWTGSLKISADPYKVGFNRDSYAFDAHTCFNELIVNNFDSEVEFLKMFLRSLFGVGTGFGIAGRNRFSKKNKKKGKNNKFRTKKKNNTKIRTKKLNNFLRKINIIKTKYRKRK